MAESIDIVKKSLTRKASDANVLDYGKIPPQAKELENAVLGALLLESGCITEVESFLFPEVFYVDAHQRVYRAISDLRKDKKNIDSLTVVEQLKKNGDLDAAGGLYYVATLTNGIGSAAHIETHARILFEKWLQREQIKWATQVIKDGYEDSDDVFESYEKHDREWRDIGRFLLNGQIQGLESQFDEAMILIERQMDRTGGFVPSRHYSINANMGGYQMQSMNVLGARPGMGKSAFAISEIYYAIKKKYKIGVFCLEPTKKQFFGRLMCRIVEISNKRVKTKDFRGDEAEKWQQAKAWIRSLPNLYTDFTGGISIEEVEMKVKKWKSEGGLDAIWIDYLQLMTVANAQSKKQNREQQIAEVSRRLKTLAKNEDIAVIAIVSLNRAPESAKDKRPSLESLRESGAIESDADTVSFLLRPEYYYKRGPNGEVIYEDNEQAAYKNICQFFNEKNREDTTFQDEFKCYLGINKFVDFNVPTAPDMFAQKEKPVEEEKGTTSADDDTPF